MNETLKAIACGDRRTAARILSRIERGDAEITPLLRELYRMGGHSHVIGITGPPGVGKSTLIDTLTAAWRSQGFKVGILAVDPSSPFSGGAVLGDRVRMARHAEDSGVFIRSLASRGELGGLVAACGDAIAVLDAMRFDVIVLETVGTGQNEIDALAYADCVLLLQTAMAGDQIQMLKAGILETADILVVTKADLPGTDKVCRQLEELAARQPHHDEWSAPVIACELSTGRGLENLLAAIEAQKATPRTPRQKRARKHRQLGVRIRAMVIAEALARLRHADPEWLAQEMDHLIDRDGTPHELVARLLEGPAE